MSLNKALLEYLKYEKLCNCANEKEQELLEVYTKELKQKEYNGQFNIESAEDVFKAYSNIKKHKKEVEQYKAKFTEAETEIYNYLLPLKGKSISYLHYYKDDNNPYQHQRKDYIFWLEDNKVTHN